MWYQLVQQTYTRSNSTTEIQDNGMLMLTIKTPE